MAKLSCVGVALAIFATACDDGVAIDPLRPQLEVDPSIDFGDNAVGLVATRQITVRNAGEITLALTIEAGPAFAGPDHAFTIAPTTLVLQPGASQELGASFQAFEPMDAPVTSSFVLVTDAIVDGRPLAATVSVVGRGVHSALGVEPNPLDFGRVLIGSSRTLPLVLRNQLTVPIPLTTPLTGDGRPAVIIDAGLGQFAILATPEADGSLLAGGGQLAPGESITVDARYTPDSSATGVEDRAHWDVSNCPSPFCAIAVQMIGRGTQAGLECAPAVVAFGGVNPGATATRNVVCANVASDPIELLDWALDTNSSTSYSVAPFSAATLLPGAEVTIRVELGPTNADLQAGLPLEGELVVRGRNAATQDGVTPVRVQLLGAAGGPTIQVTPTIIDFGEVQLGTRDRRPMLISNAGLTPLIVSMITPQSPEISVLAGPLTVEVGTSTVVMVWLEPTALGPYSSGLTIESNDGATPSSQVTILGTGIDLGSCAHSVVPASLNFGITEVGTGRADRLLVQNTGTGTCLFSRVEAHSIGSSTLAYSLPNGETTFMLGPGASTMLEVEFTPLRVGPTSGEVSYYVSDPAGSTPIVPLFGVGLGVTRIECPPPIVTDAGRAVTLMVDATSQTGTVATLMWSVVSAPTGAIGTPGQWSPDPPSAPTETFLPRLVGEYEIAVTILDGLGQSATCTTSVTALSHGLRVELNWDGMGDVDLHLHNATNSPWFGQNGTADDCFYANCSESSQPAGPIWDPAFGPYEGANPALDIDNIIGFGPENIRVDDTDIGDTYTVALHYFWDHGHGPRIGTVNIYCGRVGVPTASYTSMAMIGLDQGGCTQNTFWKVATVSFTTTSSCTITPIDTYGPGADACLAF